MDMTSNLCILKYKILSSKLSKGAYFLPVICAIIIVSIAWESSLERVPKVLMALWAMTGHIRLDFCRSLGLILWPAGCVISCKNYRSCPPPQGCGPADRHQLLLTWTPEGLSQRERSLWYPPGTDWELNPHIPIWYHFIPKISFYGNNSGEIKNRLFFGEATCMESRNTLTNMTS